MPTRDPDELMEQFAALTERAAPPEWVGRPRPVLPRAMAAAVGAAVLVSLVGVGLVYGPRLAPGGSGTRVVLPTHRDLDDNYAARMSGTLVRDGNCVYASRDGARTLVVWPSGTYLLQTRDENVVMNRADVRIAAIGEPVELGGAEFNGTPDLIEEPIPEGCTGPYWLAASVTSPLGEPRAAKWRLLPFEPINTLTTRLSVFLTEQECEVGIRPGSVIAPTRIDYRPDAVVVTEMVRTNPGTCPTDDDTAHHLVNLAEPLGQRQLIDGADGSIRWQPQPDLIAIPEQHHPEIACYPNYLEGAFLAGDPNDPFVAWVVNSEGRRVNVLWPVGFAARFSPEVELIGPIGQELARAGELLTLGGGFLPSGEFETCEVHIGALELGGGGPMPWPTGDPPVPGATPPPIPPAPETTPRPTPAPAISTIPWRVDPDSPPSVGDTEIRVLLHETGCTGGRDPRDHLEPPEFFTNDFETTITLTVTNDGEYGTCPSNPEVEYVIPLAQPLGDLPLYDGASGSFGLRWTPEAPDADLVGRLVSIDSAECGLLVSSGGQQFGVVWPSGHTVLPLGEGDEHVLMNENGDRIAFTGDDIALSGEFADSFSISCAAGQFLLDGITSISRNVPP